MDLDSEIRVVRLLSVIFQSRLFPTDENASPVHAPCDGERKIGTLIPFISFYGRNFKMLVADIFAADRFSDARSRFRLIERTILRLGNRSRCTTISGADELLVVPINLLNGFLIFRN